MDIWSRKIVGYAVHEQESMALASALIRQTAAKEQVNLHQLTLHSDNGGPMKGSTMLATLQSLGIIPSFSRPRVSDDNPFSEALFRTLKYRPLFPQDRFESLEAARAWVDTFAQWYNFEHRHSGLKFVRPIDRHTGADLKVLQQRTITYELAKLRYPERWGARSVRNWCPPKSVSVRARPNQTEKSVL